MNTEPLIGVNHSDTSVSLVVSGGSVSVVSTGCADSMALDTVGGAGSTDVVSGASVTVSLGKPVIFEGDKEFEVGSVSFSKEHALNANSTTHIANAVNILINRFIHLLLFPLNI